MRNFKACCYILALAIYLVSSQECIPATDRIDCHPDSGSSEERCVTRNCIWCPASEPGAPWCYIKPNYGYDMESLLPDENGYRVLLRRASIDSSYFGGDFDLLTLNVTFESDYRLRIKVGPDYTPRYEVPMKINPPSSVPTINLLYAVEFSNDPVFAFKVRRRSSGAVLFDTSLGGFTFADQFIQIATKLASENVYGIGENEQFSFRHNFSHFTTYPLWARGHNTAGTTNLYGVMPYYTVVEEDGNTHSVLIVNSNAQEFITRPGPSLVYRTIGGVLDIYMFLGPTPEETAQQLTEAINRSPIPPYWSLGFQLCRFGYDNLENMKAAVNRTTFYQIPLDVQYGDIDIMDRYLDFTYDNVSFAGLPEYIEELKQNGIKFVTILDHSISSTEPNYEALELGTEMDVWIKNADGTPYLASLWPGDSYFPDYSKNSTREWWIHLIVKFHDLLKYDALWIDMNEPSNFASPNCDRENNLNFPPYIPPIVGGQLDSSSICPDLNQEFGVHYDSHSLYGWSEAEPTLAGVRAALGKRSFVVSRSTFPGIGKWAAHWLGDNYGRWSDLRNSIIGMLQYNQFGIPYVGADICGHNLDAEPQLCLRWHQVGSFYPYSRNHNGRGLPDQDPGNFGPEFAQATRNVLLTRYTLLPYLYTLFYQHVKYGNTVVRALWHLFPTDSNTLGIDRQFLWGDGLLISPVVVENATTVDAYFPNSRWYSYYDGAEVSNAGCFQTISAPLDFIPVHIQGGNIIPTQEPAINTELSKLNPFGLIIALDSNNRASGSLYIDDGDSIDPHISGLYFEVNYTVNAQQLRNVKVHEGYDVSTKVLDIIRLLGHGNDLQQLIVNGSLHSDYSYNSTTGEIFMRSLNVALNADLTISWI